MPLQSKKYSSIRRRLYEWYQSDHRKIIQKHAEKCKNTVLMILVPLAVLTLMYLVFDVNNNTSIRLGVPDTTNTTFIEGMPDNVEVITYELAPVLETLLDADDLDEYNL